MTSTHDPIENKRDALFYSRIEHFLRLAKKALSRGLVTSQFVVICIDVGDSSWKVLVDHLMPGFNWNDLREPIAQGVVDLQDFRRFLNVAVPSLVGKLSPDIPGNLFHVCVLADGGACLYFIECYTEDDKEQPLN